MKLGFTKCLECCPMLSKHYVCSCCVLKKMARGKEGERDTLTEWEYLLAKGGIPSLRNLKSQDLEVIYTPFILMKQEGGKRHNPHKGQGCPLSALNLLLYQRAENKPSATNGEMFALYFSPMVFIIPVLLPQESSTLFRPCVCI